MPSKSSGKNWRPIAELVAAQAISTNSSSGSAAGSTLVVDEVTEELQRQISWSLHRQAARTDQTRREDHDPELVLSNITAQTNLTFNEEKRFITVLFCE
jgi:hypothetical protein